MPLDIQKIDALAEGFEQELHVRLAELKVAWQGPQRGTQAAMESIHHIAHAVAASGDAFGYLALAQAAHAVEAQAQLILKDFGKTPPDAYKHLHQYLNTLAICMSNPVRERAPDEGGDVAPEGGKHILMVGACPCVNNLESEFLNFGFTVSRLEGPSGLEAAIEDKKPHVIVSNVSHAEAFSDWGQQFPLIFMSHEDSLNKRLAAVRAGGAAFFVTPCDATDVIDTVDKLLGTEKSQAYRVVIIEDANSLAGLYAAALESVGMRTLIITHAMDALSQMDGFHPDLILMDIYMPQVNGVELARVIRQHKAYFGVPIVFLSAERDLSKQLTALGSAGDDFLSKPVDEHRLIHAVTIRASRYRALRSQMVKDSLTGLLNHSTLLGRLEHELQRAGRKKTSLCFAMIDIDHFKSVNDTWGHSVGDHVILNLSRLLRERLRRTDLVGRYGGEEFAVIMPDTQLEDAASVLNTLRQTFACVEQHAQDQIFRVTFSVGLAGFGGELAGPSLIEQADKALYEAKKAGRNCLKIAPD